MEVKQVLLADYANVSREGKLNVLGIFTEIYAQNFPIAHPQMHLIISWQATRAESGRAKKIEVQLLDEDGKKLFTVSNELVVPDGKSGKLISGNNIMCFNGIRFEKAGQYAFHILVNDDQKGSVAFGVVHLTPKSQG